MIPVAQGKMMHVTQTTTDATAESQQHDDQV